MEKARPSLANLDDDGKPKVRSLDDILKGKQDEAYDALTKPRTSAGGDAAPEAAADESQAESPKVERRKREGGVIATNKSDSEEEEIEYFGERQHSNEGAGSKSLKAPTPSPQAEGEDSGDEGPREGFGENGNGVGSGPPIDAPIDDEFDYAFEGKAREGETHKKKFKEEPLPKDVLSRLHRQSIDQVIEESVEDEVAKTIAAGQPDSGEKRRQKSIEMTAEQWGAIIDIQYEDDRARQSFRDSVDSDFSYKMALDKLQPDMDNSDELDPPNNSLFEAFTRCFKASCVQADTYETDKQCIISLADTKFGDEEEINGSILSTIYQKIYGTSVVERFGEHWKELGFQGDDPATDLRSTGVWGLLQLLFFAENCYTQLQIMLDVANDSKYSFPLAIVSLNISHWGLLLLKDGAFKACAAEINSLPRAINAWYCGAMKIFLESWKVSKATMNESGYVMQAVRHRIQTKSSVRSTINKGRRLSEFYKPKSKEVDVDEEDLSQENLDYIEEFDEV